MTDKGSKVFIMIILCISFFSLFFLPLNSLITAIAGLPGFLLFLIVCHEAGHALGCVINGNRIISLNILTLCLSSDGLKVRPGQEWDNYLSFEKSPDDVTVYLGGIIASLVITVGLILGSIILKLSVLKFYSLVSVLHLTRNAMPYGDKSDMKRVLMLIKARRHN